MFISRKISIKVTRTWRRHFCIKYWLNHDSYSEDNPNRATSESKMAPAIWRIIAPLRLYEIFKWLEPFWFSNCWSFWELFKVRMEYNLKNIDAIYQNNFQQVPLLTDKEKNPNNSIYYDKTDKFISRNIPLFFCPLIIIRRDEKDFLTA